MTNTSRKIKAGLALVMGGTLVLVLSVFILYRQGTNDAREMIASAKPGADISISNVRHVATKGGKTEWRLDAHSANLMDQRKEAVFESPSITFFTRNRKEIHLKAEEGMVRTDSNDIEVQGDVVLQSDGYRMETQSLNYEHAEKVFSADVPVRIHKAEFDLEADSASFDLKTNRMTFKGNVKGRIGGGISL